ncbi:PGC-1 and ERR-induced regulator in muscle protein 1 [Armadillidium vulgare]|nr:PGC-1 and ERR-induced regulator in muscle protein 1 [Armadillidium vulgare]
MNLVCETFLFKNPDYRPSDEAKNVPKSETKTKITTEKKEERDTSLDSLPAHQFKNNGQLNKSGRGCQFGGQSYFEGQYIPGVGGPCQACYCLRGQQQCTELRCKPPRSEVNGKLPRNDLLSDLGFKYNFDYDLSPDSHGKVMENHIRIVRESQAEPVSEDPEVIPTTESIISDEPVTAPVITSTTLKSTTTMIDNVEVVASLNVMDFESTKMNVDPPIEKPENTTSSKENKLQVNDTNERMRDTPPVEDVPTDTVPETFNKSSVNVEDASVTHIEDDSNITGTTNPPSEFYDDYYYDYEELEDTTSVPRLSITEILNKLRNKNEGSIGSLADILPDPITGTNVEEVNNPEEPLKEKEQDKHNRVQDFVSYDVDVGASIIAGTDESDVIGVGQVIPIDLHTEEELPAILSSQSPPDFSSTTNTPSTSTTTTSTTTTAITTTTPVSTTSTTEITSTTSEKTKLQSTLFDTFFSLFRGKDPKDKETKEPSPKLPPLPPPPPFLEKPPPPPPQSDIGEENNAADIFEAPPSFFKPPPPPPLTEDAVPSEVIEDKFDTETKTNELDSELDFEAKPTIENEVRARPKLPNGSATRNQLPPLRRRPTISEGSKPFNPGLFASRPKLPILKPSADVEEEAPVAELPSDPLVEGGFSAIKPANSTTTTTTTTEKPEMTDEKPTLPPSLPNLQIIPFVAADALVNQGSPPVEEQNGFSPKPFGNVAAQDCREGGKVWKNGETVARGDNDPCVVCRCHLGKVICQRYECAKVPEGCTAEETPQEGECCPKITCDKSANVSIIDTLPSFRPIEEEVKEEEIKEEEPSSPIRPSPFSHHNRRPPFIPGLRRPKPSNPLLSLTKPKLPSAFRTTEEPVAEKREVDETEAEESPKSGPIRPIRPISPRHPLKQLKPTTNKPIGGRPRPFSFRNRTGTRPPFVPPRRKSGPGGLSNIIAFTKSPPEVTETTSPSFTTTTPTTTRLPAFILRSSTPPPEEIEETVRPEQLDAETFDNIFADLLPKDEDSLPQPIHSDVFEEETQPDNPFIPQPDKPFNTRPDKPFITQPDKPFIPQPDKPFNTRPDKPFITQPDKPFIAQPDKPFITRPDKPFITQSDKPFITQPDKPFNTRPDKPFNTQPDKPFIIQPDKPFITQPDKPFTQPDKPFITQPDKPFNTQPDSPFILPEILIPKPLPPTNKITLDHGDITNFVQQDKFSFIANSRRPEVKFERQPAIAPIRVQKPNKKLPEIPEVVKAQLPLGNDPILVSGLLELAGCNVYGRMFEVGEDIQEISGQCKACQCTKVGVQCLPIC